MSRSGAVRGIAIDVGEVIKAEHSCCFALSVRTLGAIAGIAEAAS